MSRTTTFTEADAPRIETLLQSGKSYRQIADELDCHKDTVIKFVKRHLPEWHERRADQHTRPPSLKLLTLDIETQPGTAYFFNEYADRPLVKVISEPRAISFAAKWLGHPNVEFKSDYHDGRMAMVARAHELLSEADGVITYNGDRFDLPHLNLEFLRNGDTPPAPYRSIDLLKTIRRKFNFSANKLDRVSQSLGIGSKVAHEGFALWERCMAGDAKAWAKMREYNIGDVTLTEELYLDILPWIEGHPSYAAFTTASICPNCGSEGHEDGYYRTKTGTYKRYQCNECGKWYRDARRSFRTEITETAMS